MEYRSRESGYAVRALSAPRVYYIHTGAATLFNATAFTVLAVYYITVAGLDPLQLVLVGTVVEATAFLCEVPTGVVADTYSRRLSVVIGVALGGLAFLVGLVPVFAVILVAQVLHGIAWTFISGAHQAWIADEVGEERVGAIYLRAAQVALVARLGGIFLSVVLASLHLALPILLAGLLTLALAIFLVIVMPETGFRPAPRGERSSWATMAETFRAGLRVTRGSPVALTLLGGALFMGLFSEGFDRLWEPHLLLTIGLPALGALPAVVWFGIVRAGAVLAGLGATEVVRRLDTASQTGAARSLFVINATLLVSVAAFGLAGNFWLAVAAYWLATVMRTLDEPIAATWLNQHLDPRVRATVLSMNSQANAFGQIAGGPPIGTVGVAVSLRAALVATALLLSPALVLYGRFLRRGSMPASAPVTGTTQPEP